MILLRVSIFFLAMLLLPDWYIYKVFAKKNKARWARYACWLPSVLLLVALAVFFITGQAYYNAFGIYIVVALCVSVPKAVFVLSHWAFHRCKKAVLPLALCLASGTLVYLAFGATKGKHYYQVKQVAFYSSQLPLAFDGYRILQVSDIHSGSWNGDVEAMRKAVELCNAQQPDMAVFTGDLVNYKADEVMPYRTVLSELKAKDGVYAVLGNHDYATYVNWNSKADQIANIENLIRCERKMGWNMLMNENRIIKRGNDSIALVGVENSGNPPFPNRGNLPKAQRGTDGMFKVLLSHDPTHWRRNVLPETDIQLMLAGHTHDMQFSIFGFSPAAFIYPEHRGMYLDGERGLYVNIGLGYVLFPMRLGAWPEITVVTLKKK